jgi:DNA-binding NtrC family response regulator
MQQVFKMVGRVSHSDAPVMITGESGSGKELVARAIHRYSARSSKSFIAINCAAIPEQLLESELFGHEKGSFTGATGTRIGRFEQSHGGTLFLDEIGDMPLSLQGKILRVLQDGEFSRVGGNETLKGDVRIVAATNKNLEQEVSERKFREDLFYRLNVVRIQLPPLRQRTEDIRLLAEYFVQKVAIHKHLPQLKLSEEAVRVLESHSWPGNVRELENTIHRAVLLASGSEIGPEAIRLPDGTQVSAATVAITQNSSVQSAVVSATAVTRGLVGRTVSDVERDLILDTLDHCLGNRTHAANILGISIRTLRNKLREYSDSGLSIPSHGEQRPSEQKMAG